jgi:hypothetical protein
VPQLAAKKARTKSGRLRNNKVMALFRSCDGPVCDGEAAEARPFIGVFFMRMW